ncbi:MAG: hypothetical protein IKE74_07260 [Mogibacterium sp.]|nr:hypothetical protein [Mogibacterium sp.]
MAEDISKEHRDIREEDKVSRRFIWFHATSRNGGAMCISATIISYFSLYVQETVGITAAQRSVSFLIIGTIYVIAAAAGILIYRRLSYHFAPNLLIADMAATVIVFVFSALFRNASVYDP